LFVGVPFCTLELGLFVFYGMRVLKSDVVMCSSLVRNEIQKVVGICNLPEDRIDDAETCGSKLTK
jgi:hypothetical protein